MRVYFEEDYTKPAWLTIFLSLMLVLITLFVFLSTYTEHDKSKIEIFRNHFKQSLVLSGKGQGGKRSIIDNSTVEPLDEILNRIKGEGLSVKLMNEFLNQQKIKELKVKRGERGVVVVLPVSIGFDNNKSVNLNKKILPYLNKIAFLAADLTYLVEIKGYSGNKIPKGIKDELELSSRRALAVYDFFIKKGVNPVKLKVTGCGYDNSKSENKDRVEIAFKEISL